MLGVCPPGKRPWKHLFEDLKVPTKYHPVHLHKYVSLVAVVVLVDSLERGKQEETGRRLRHLLCHLHRKLLLTSPVRSHGC